MNSSYTKMISPLAKAKNLGSGGGTHHWWMQRWTSIIMLPLICWLVYFIHTVSGSEARVVIEHLHKLYNLIPAMLLLIIGLYHGALGMQVVIEDYISCLSVRYFLIISLKIFTLVTVLAGALALLSLLK